MALTAERPAAMSTAFVFLLSVSQLDLPPAAPVVSDSAGITITTNAGVRSHPGWQLAPGPSLQIGSVMGGPAEFVDISGIRWLSPNVLAVADAGRGSVVAFDSTGRHLWSSGRRGGGPGEFGNGGPTMLWAWPGDTVVAWDERAGRASWIDAAGDLVRLWSVPRDPLRSRTGAFIPTALPRAVGFVDRDALLVTYSQGRPSPAGRRPGVVTQTRVELAIVTPDAPRVSVGRGTDRTWFVFAWQGSIPCPWARADLVL